MILIKKQVDQKIIYEPISFEEAKGKNRTDLAFTEAHEMKMFEDALLGKEVEFPHPKTKNDKIKEILPYLREEDKHDIVAMIIENSEDYRGLDIITVLPYLSEKDCNWLFKAALTDPNLRENVRPGNLVAYVTEQCLDEFVDEYIEGSWQDAPMDTLYPYMNGKTIKKLFQYLLTK